MDQRQTSNTSLRIRFGVSSVIKLCIEPPNTTDVWDAAEDARSLSYQCGGGEVILIYQGVMLRVRNDRDSVKDIYDKYEGIKKNGKTQQAVR